MISRLEYLEKMLSMPVAAGHHLDFVLHLFQKMKMEAALQRVLLRLAFQGRLPVEQLVYDTASALVIRPR